MELDGGSQGQTVKMRVPTSHLQQLAIFTTLLTGAGVGTMYYLMQKKFRVSEWHRLALQRLEACPSAMETLGVPPLKVHSIRLMDGRNRVDRDSAQIMIPVAGSKAGGYLCTYSVRDSDTNSWTLNQAVLQLQKGQTIDLLSPAAQSQLQGADTGPEN